MIIDDDIEILPDPNTAVERYCRNWDGKAPYARATIVRTEGPTAAKAGAKAIITAEGELIGFLGGGCVRGAVIRTAQQAIEAGEPKLIRVRPKEEVTQALDEEGVELHGSACPSKGSADVFIEPVMPRPPLIVIGSSYVAKAISELAAMLGFSLVQVSATPQAAGAAPLASALAQPHQLKRAFIVVATQGAGDYAALSAALKTNAPYVAFVASSKKAKAMRERLANDGLAEASVERLRAPAGLAIGSETPAEIAVAILAEMIKVRHDHGKHA
jgi:xanthine dehydrogenase accessory factor